jgi:GTP-binding protein era
MNNRSEMETTENKKSGFVALVGRPNVGKSTLMNTLIGQKIAITSNKPQTTRDKIQTVYTDERGQIVFLDTPGVHKAKNKLGEYMVGVVKHTLNDVDIILWIVEANDFIGEKEEYILEMLATTKKPIILAINKMDILKNKDEVLSIIAKFNSLREFAAIVPISAKDNKNLDELLKVLFEHLNVGPLYYDEETVTDQPVRQICAELIREKALRLMKDEIPHGIAVEVLSMKKGKNTVLNVEADIVCEREAHKKIIIGSGGSMLKKIGTAARKDIEDLTQSKVNLKLWVKVRKDWRDSDIQMKNFGYREN